MPGELDARFRVSLSGKEEIRAFFVNSEAQARKFGASISQALRTVNRELDRFAERIRRTPTDSFFVKSEENARRYTTALSAILKDASRDMQAFRDLAGKPISFPRSPRGPRAAGAAGAGEEAGAPAARSGGRLRAPSGKTWGELSATAAIQTGRAAYGVAADVIGAVAPDMSLGGQVKGVIDLRDRINEIHVAAGNSGMGIQELTNKILAASKATNQFGIDSSEALQAFVAKTGDLQTGIQNLELYGKVATATTSELKDIATIGADISMKMGIRSRGEQASAFGILAKQADIGNVELKDMARYFGTMTAAFQSANLTGISGMQQGGGLAQLFQTGTKSAAQTATSITATFSDLVAKRDKVAELGVAYDPNRANMVDVLRQLIVKSGGDVTKLQPIFGREAMKGVRRMAALYRGRGAGETGFELLDQYINAAGQGGDIIGGKYGERMQTGAAAVKAAQITVEQASNKNLGDAFERLAKAAPRVADAFDWFTRHPVLGAIGAGAGVFGKNLVIEAARSGVRGALTGKGGIFGEDSVVGRAVNAGGMRVFVTNWPLGGGFGGGGGAGGAERPVEEGLGAQIAKQAKWILPLAAGIGTFLYSPDLNKGEGAMVRADREQREREDAEREAQRGALETLKIAPLFNVFIDRDGNVEIESGTRSPARLEQRTASDPGDITWRKPGL
jgi:hypothetical protein